VIDGLAGRYRGFCGDANEVEATVVAGDRVYMFTLFQGDRVSTEAEERAVFEALLATITLDPAAADRPASPAPSGTH